MTREQADTKLDMEVDHPNTETMAIKREVLVGEHPDNRITYFDEAHELDNRFWILLRLLSHQSRSTRMWYVFMGTKSSISYFAPTIDRSESSDFAHGFISHRRIIVSSLRLRKELETLLPPYIALDFDQNMPVGGGTAAAVKFAQLRSLEHLAKYGRPLYVVFVFYG